MTLNEIIKLFEEIEAGNDGQVIARHLHHSIAQVNDQAWPTNERYGHRFSDFLKALRDAE